MRRWVGLGLTLAVVGVGGCHRASSLSGDGGVFDADAADATTVDARTMDARTMDATTADATTMDAVEAGAAMTCDALETFVRDHAHELIDASPTGSPYPMWDPPCPWCDVFPVEGEFAFRSPQWARRDGDDGVGAKLVVHRGVVYGNYRNKLFVASLATPQDFRVTDIPAGWQMFAAGDWLIVMTVGGSTLWEVDIRDALQPRLVRMRTFSHRILGAWQSDGRLRIALTGHPDRLGLREEGWSGAIGTVPTGDVAALVAARAENHMLIDRSVASDWIPTFRDTISDPMDSDDAGVTTDDEPLFGCGDVVLPEERLGVGVLSLVEIDADRGLNGARVRALFAESVEVDAIDDGLFVMAHPWRELAEEWLLDDSERPAGPSTLIFRFGRHDEIPLPARVPGMLRSLTPAGQGRALGAAFGSFGYGWSGFWDPQRTSLVTIDYADDAVTAVAAGDFETDGVGLLVSAGDKLYAPSYKNEQPAFVFDVADPTQPTLDGTIELPGPWVYAVPRDQARAVVAGREVDAEWNYSASKAYVSLVDASGVTGTVDLGNQFHVSDERTMRLSREHDTFVLCGTGLNGETLVACHALDISNTASPRLSGSVIHRRAGTSAGASIAEAVMTGNVLVTFSAAMLRVDRLPDLTPVSSHTLTQP